MNIYSRLLPFVKPYRTRFIQASFAMAGVAAFNGIFLYVLRYVVNDLFQHRDPMLLWLVVFGVPSLVGLKNIASYIQNYLMSWMGQRITQDIREQLFRHLHVLGLDFFAEHKSGDVLARVTNDLNTLQSTLNFIPLYLIRDTLTVLVLTSGLFFLNWRFALMAMFIIPLVGFLLAVLGKKMRQSSLQSQIIMGQIYSRFQESLEGMLVIKAFNYEEGAIGKFKEENQSFFEQMMRYLRATALAGPLMEFIGAAILAIFVYLGYKEISLGRMTPGDSFAFLFAFIAAYAPIKNLARLQSELQRGLASGERIFQLLDAKPTILVKPNAPKFSGLEREVRLERLTFQYPSRDIPALKDVSLTLRRGERIAVVGPSGSGKSTLVSLLLRLYEPQQGRILYDGTDLRELDTHSVRESIGLVTQDTVLFNDTVFQNVSLGRRVVTLREIEEALRIANAEEFVSQLPQGCQTILGDRGVKLSGGQRQRLAIARAVLKNPSLLILDEATSHLDSASEEAVQTALERLMQGRTVLVIAHRLSTVDSADRIYVLHQGTLMEEGTHRSLLEQGSLYRRLYEMQQTPSPEKAATDAPDH